MLLVSEQNRDRPQHLEILQRHLRALGAEDAIGVTGVDPNGLGIHIFAPTAARPPLSGSERIHWRMLTAHLSAGQRLQHRLGALLHGSKQANDLPLAADAVIDPKTFVVKDTASGELGDTAIVAHDVSADVLSAHAVYTGARNTIEVAFDSVGYRKVDASTRGIADIANACVSVVAALCGLAFLTAPNQGHHAQRQHAHE
jgi:hypothetical protein